MILFVPMCSICHCTFSTNRSIFLLYAKRIPLHLFLWSSHVAIHPYRGIVAFFMSRFCTHLLLIWLFTRIVSVYFICVHLFTYRLDYGHCQIVLGTPTDPKSMTVSVSSFAHNRQYPMATFNLCHSLSFHSDFSLFISAFLSRYG